MHICTLLIAVIVVFMKLEDKSYYSNQVIFNAYIYDSYITNHKQNGMCFKCRDFRYIVINYVDYLKKCLCWTNYQVVEPHENQIRCAVCHAPNIKLYIPFDENRSLVHQSLIALIPFATSFRNV